LELIFEQPYCKTESIVKNQIAQRKAAERYLKELERLEILSSEKIGKEVIYLNLKLLRILRGKT
jgi:Fic family protein